MDSVYKAARKEKIDGIVTCASDVAVPTVGYVAERIGLSGPTYNLARTLTNKALFRQFQHANGINSPPFALSSGWKHMKCLLSQMPPPILFKPVDTSGSRGISLVAIDDETLYKKAFDHALRFSREGQVCAEALVMGSDVSGDGFLLNGKAHVVITKKHKNGFVPIGHEIPTDLPPSQQRLLIAEIERNCKTAGYITGPIDFDARVGNEEATILEMSPRLGGNAIPSVIHRGTGVDLYEHLVTYASGDAINIANTLQVHRPCASWIIGSETGGTLSNISSVSSLKAAFSELFFAHIDVNIGDKIAPFEHSAHALGYIIFDRSSDSTFDQNVQQLKKELKIELKD